MNEGIRPNIDGVMAPYMQQAREAGYPYNTWQAYFAKFANGVAITNFEQTHKKGLRMPDARFRITTIDEAKMWQEAAGVSRMAFGVVAGPNETVMYRGAERTLSEGEFFVVAANTSLPNGADQEANRMHRLGQEITFVARIREQGGKI